MVGARAPAPVRVCDPRYRVTLEKDAASPLPQVVQQREHKVPTHVSGLDTVRVHD